MCGDDYTHIYEDLFARLLTFSGRNKLKVSHLELAKAGFYFYAEPDLVRCFCCGIMIWSWKETDDIVEVHKRHSKYCQYILQLGQFGKPQEPQTGIITNIFTFIQGLVRRIRNCRPSREGIWPLKTYNFRKSPPQNLEKL